MLAMLAVIAQRAAAQGTDTMTAAEVTDVSGGRVAVRQWPIESAPWPRVRLFRFINATPEQSVAMLADYAHQRDYNADLDVAQVVKYRDSARTEVYFSYRPKKVLGFSLPRITYTVLDQIHREPNDTYAISWHLLSGSNVKSIQGSARFSPWTNPATGQAGTLLTYDQFVWPDVVGASLFFVRRKAVGEMVKAINAIASETERERLSDKSGLDKQIAELRRALTY
jgi:hypothetical protein